MRLFRNICLWICAAAFLSPFIYAFFFCYPRGDDFDSVTRSMFLFDLPGGIYEICREWLTWSGRYTYHFLAVFLGKAAGSRFACGIVCASVAALYWFAVRSLPPRKHGGPGDDSFFATLAIITLLACHGRLQNFYLFTDSLTICLQGGAYLVFLNFLCSLHDNLRENIVDKANAAATRAVIASIIAIGVYEHAALAVFWTSLCSLCLAFMSQPSGRFSLLRRLEQFPTRLYARIFVFSCAAILFSFLAPGNFNRNHTRGIDATSQLNGLFSIGADWLDVCQSFFTSLWIPGIALLVLMRSFETKTDTSMRCGNLCLCLAAPFACALFTLSIACLHALSDAPLTSTPKLGASIHLYMAIAWGVFLWNLPLPKTIIKFRAHLPTLGAIGLFIIFASSVNLQSTFVSAGSGQMLELAASMEARRNYLLSIADKFPPEPFGLYGEVVKPGIRKRAIDTSRPQVIVQAISPPVFPVYMDEALAPEYAQWPNLWAAWLWGCGAIKSSSPAPQNAILKVISGNGMELHIPEKIKGLEGAWRVSATGGPNSTFADDWLVLRGFKGKSITIMKPVAPTWMRLAPLPLQYYLQDKLAANETTNISIFMSLSGTFFHFYNYKAIDDWLALPIGRINITPQYLFASFDGLTYYRLQPFL